MSVPKEIEQKLISPTQAEIIRRALYYDVFHYPLKVDELYETVPIKIGREEFESELRFLVENGFLKEEEGYFLSPTSGSNQIERRKKGNQGAKNIMPTAHRYSRIIASFPFVEAVCLSGALSKNYFDEKGDIDFFIITKPNRLWICRTLLILRYKFLPKSRKKFWCVNYFISSDNLIIEDTNQFTATELAYLIPTVNYPVYKQIMSSNTWCTDSFPNKNRASESHCIDTPKPLLKKLFEFAMQGLVGETIDNLLLKITLKHWRKKYPMMNYQDFELQFRSRKNVCKRHTTGYQGKVLYAWEQKQREFERYHNLSLR